MLSVRGEKNHARISGPLLDRVDLQVEVPVAPFERLEEKRRGEPSAALRERVQAARERQTASIKDSTTRQNGMMSAKEVGRCRRQHPHTKFDFLAVRLTQQGKL